MAAQGPTQSLEGRPVDVLHGNEVDLLDDAEFVDRHDVAVTQRDQGFGLGDEQVDELALARKLRVDLLDDQRLLEAVGAN